MTKSKKTFIPVLVAGYPSMNDTLSLISASHGRADAVCVALPFSDPTADGPNSAAAQIEALKTCADPLEAIAALGASGGAVPLIVAAYANTLYSAGYERFFAGCKGAGVGAVMVHDVPVEESGELFAAAQPFGVDVVLTAVPGPRLQKVCSKARGAVRLFGMGANISALGAAAEKIAQKGLNVYVDCGICTPQAAANVASACGGVLVAEPFAGVTAEEGEALLADYSEAIKGAK